MAIDIKSGWELSRMSETGQLHSEIFAEVEPLIGPGMSTFELDRRIHKAIQDRKGIAPQIGYRAGGSVPFPNATCMSIDDVVVHGFPSKRPLREGEILKIDFLFTHGGYTTDMARTYAIGKVSPEARRLIEVTEEAFWVGLQAMQVGNRTGDVANTIQQFVEIQHGMWCVRDMQGHGVGRKLHEDPNMPNFGKVGTGPKLRPGMTIALEPMVTLYPVQPLLILADGWTATAGKGNLAAHYENTVAITDSGPVLLTGSQKQLAAVAVR